MCAPQFIRIASEKGYDLKQWGRGCIAGLSYCRIYPTGEVTPCPYLPVTLGNILDTGFKDIWFNSPVLKKLRDFDKLEGKCGVCGYRNACGGCRARAYGTNRSREYLQQPSRTSGSCRELYGRGTVVPVHPGRCRYVNETTILVDERDRELLQWLQDEFPVTERPWLAGGARLGMAEAEVLSRVRRLSDSGVIRSVHTILDKQKTGSGSSTLIAMRVPEEKIPDIVPVINEYPGVTHNYLREYEFNLWFTVNAGDLQELTGIITGIKKRTGVCDTDILDLRTVRVFKTDVRFRFSDGAQIKRLPGETPVLPPAMDETDRAILRITQEAIPLVEEPFRKISEQLGIEHRVVLARLDRLVRQGIIRRIGGSVNQRKLGIVANAVVAWKVPEDLVGGTAMEFSSDDEVTHCYERTTVPGLWDYNIFTVVHGYNRESVETWARGLSQTTGVSGYRVIFSTKQFKRTSLIHDLKEFSRERDEMQYESDKILLPG